MADQSAQRVCAVVVTRNRRALLERCLERLAAQTRPPEEVLVIDNASDDGTAAMVRERFPSASLVVLSENVGGAGGFHRGLGEAYDRGHDWLWVLDDDTYAQPRTLEALLDGAARAPRAPLLVCSQVRWKDGSLHPMNMPWPRWDRPAELALGSSRGLVLVRHATFVSAAVHRSAVERFGLPLAHYFIWTDDFEYTGRILRDQPGYLVPDSVVEHWTQSAHSPATAAPERFSFFVRNSLLVLRGSSLRPAERGAYLIVFARLLRGFLREHHDRRALTVLARAVRAGLRDPVR